MAHWQPRTPRSLSIVDTMHRACCVQGYLESPHVQQLLPKVRPMRLHCSLRRCATSLVTCVAAALLWSNWTQPTLLWPPC